MTNQQRKLIFHLLVENRLMLEGFAERAGDPSLTAKYLEEIKLNQEATLSFSKLLRDS
tara:strand:+ start:903 stop:1076 length:174 start_codon:yes stop_codon:yes gene_type:complete